MSDDLVEWLRAQLDDDQEKAIDGQRASLDDGWPFWVDTDDIGDYEAANAYRDHFKPSRVLREVEAKRKIIDKIVPEATGLDIDHDMEFATVPRDEAVDPYLGDRLLRLLALPYADRPGYQESWRPT